MLENVFSNLIANFIGWLAIYFANRIRLSVFSKFGWRDPRNWRYTIFILLVTWCVINLIIYLPVASTLPVSLKTTIPIFTSLVIFVLLWRDIYQFWKVGIYGADPKIKEGIDYQNSLKLCQNSLSFLGVGASKLTSTDELISALERCSDDAPARFLLFEPTNQKLTEAAQRAKRPKEEYKQVVLHSLRTLAQLKNERNFNIEVRFYKSPPTFRLMFIDNSLCLMSYNIFGKGDGSDFPQLHLVNIPGIQQEKSFYYPFKLYYERLWDDGLVWDFQGYLSE